MWRQHSPQVRSASRPTSSRRRQQSIGGVNMSDVSRRGDRAARIERRHFTPIFREPSFILNDADVPNHTETSATVLGGQSDNRQGVPEGSRYENIMHGRQRMSHERSPFVGTLTRRIAPELHETSIYGHRDTWRVDGPAFDGIRLAMGGG